MTPRTPNNKLYLDNAATSFPKPDAVHAAVIKFATELGASPGRGSYQESIEAGRLLYQARERINTLINGQDPDHIIFTLNCSDALNLAIKGVVQPGDHVITTELDHNSILRPFNKLVADGVVTQTRVACDPVTGLVEPQAIAEAIRPNTKLIALLHGSNVTGTVQPIEAIGAIAHERGVVFIVDAAQTLGHLPVDVRAMHIDLLAAPGHKGLLGPLGTGFLYIRPGVEEHMTTLREGGTGSVSELDTQPEFLPDRFEPGSHNTMGILGLSEGVQYILDEGIDNLHRHEQRLTRTFLDTLNELETPGLRLYGPPTAAHRCAVFSIRIDGYPNPQELSHVLEQQHGVLTRSGLHCAPGAHQTIDTLDLGGTTRLSFSQSNTEEDAIAAANAISQVCQGVHTPA
ncbi:MAG: aminotransferase class V-fold PLP-dependent enzyme [Planctomycetota bacterium]|jgi:cysteine desulfurase family protein